MSSFRYIKSTTKITQLVILKYSAGPIGIIPQYKLLCDFLVFIHTVHKTITCCGLHSHIGNERAGSAAKIALQKDVAECLISYTDAYQYISQYVRDLW